jgi:hypothetical protein
MSLKKMAVLRTIKQITIVLGLVFFLQACSSMEALVEVPTQSRSAAVEGYDIELHQRSIQLYDPIDLERRAVDLKLDRRVDNLYLLLDQSGALDETYRDVNLKHYAQEITRRLLRTLPAHQLGGGLWVIDSRSSVEAPISSVFNSGTYDAELSDSGALAPVGTAELSQAIDRLNRQISQQKGRSALLVLTRWDRIDRSVVEAIMRLRQHRIFDSGVETSGQLDSRRGSGSQGVCVYTLGVGNRLSRTQIDDTDSCGFSQAADKVAQPRDMAHFIERMLFIGPADTDNDGIYDYLDQCAATPVQRIVNAQGCPVFDDTVAGGLR